MRETLDLAHLTDAGFNALYNERVLPLFAGAEGERLAAVKSFRTRLSIGIVVTIGVAAAIWIASREGAIALFVGLGGLVATYAIAYAPLQKFGKQVKVKTIDVIAQAIGVGYNLGGDAPAVLPRFRKLHLLPSADREQYEDFFHGERLGCAFDLCEAHFEEETRDKDGHRHYHTTFRGLIIRMAFPKEFLGVTVVRRDAGVFNALRGLGELKRVGLGDSGFERAFEVYGTDQVEARYLVHPVFMERLIALETAYKGKQLRCAFEAGDLLLAVEAPDRFEIGDLFQPLADPARARRIVDDIAEVMKLMDAVLTAERAPLVGRAN